MTVLDFIYLFTGGAVSVFLILFGVTSLGERKARAAAVSFGLFVVFSTIWFYGWYRYDFSDIALLVPVGLILLVTALFFLPLGRRHPIAVGEVTERVDERDTMFAREEYQPGTERYDEYYAARPEFKAIDDSIRHLPELLAPGGRFYDPVGSTYIESLFTINEEFVTMVDGEVGSPHVEVEPQSITRQLKDLTRHLGADDVGIAELNPAWVYSHVGRGPEPWGKPIDLGHKYVIVFTLEMNYDHVEDAPRLPITEETAVQYLNGALISTALAEFIRQLGYPARAHIAGSNYQIMLPPVAYNAGLGELGRHGYLITPRHGARVRLGAVTTDLPLISDQPIEFGVQDFCETCKKCAANCPSKSIPFETKTTVRGVEKWLLNMETCMRYWRAIGTDCGLCMKVCPFSHPPSFAHNLIRAGIKHSSFARRISVYGDDLFYGRKVPKYPEA